MKSKEDASTSKDEELIHKHTVGAGNLGRIKKGVYPSFGSNQVRELKLINEEEISEVPGPGRYDLEPLNMDDLLRQCDDKRVVREILANLHERMPTHTFVSKGPRIAVFQENTAMKIDARDKYYDQDKGTIAEGQLKLS